MQDDGRAVRVHQPVVAVRQRQAIGEELGLDDAGLSGMDVGEVADMRAGFDFDAVFLAVGEVVADLDGMMVGHILLTGLEGPRKALALAPLGVDPEWRDFLIGTELTDRAINAARVEGWHSIFVVGDPVYYGRFGFRADLAGHVETPYPGPAFQALELVPGAVADYRGGVTYPKAFEDA